MTGGAPMTNWKLHPMSGHPQDRDRAIPIGHKKLASFTAQKTGDVLFFYSKSEFLPATDSAELPQAPNYKSSGEQTTSNWVLFFSMAMKRKFYLDLFRPTYLEFRPGYLKKTIHVLHVCRCFFVLSQKNLPCFLRTKHNLFHRFWYFVWLNYPPVIKRVNWKSQNP